MSFVLWLRELESTKFRTTPEVLMAIFSGRLGSRDLTIMHFKESSEMTTLEYGSTNANFSNDFSPSASLSPTSIKCASYEDILDALHGLASLGQEVSYDHLRKLTSRLRNFVANNMSADPENTPARVRLTKSAREREIFRETVCFPNRSAPPDAKTPCLPGSQEDCTGTAQTGILTLRELNSATESVSRTVTSPGSVYQSSSRGVKFPTEEEDRLRTGTAQRPSHLRPVISVKAAAVMHSNARERSNLLRVTRRATLAQAMAKLGVTLPPDNYPLSRPGVAGPEFLLDIPLRKALSELHGGRAPPFQLLSKCPFGVVDKSGEDTNVTGRTTHDLSYSEGTSINDCTDQDSIVKPEYTHCDAVATEILKSKRVHPNARVCVMAGDVASAFRNISIHSNSMYLFAGHIEEDGVIVIELAALFGWTRSPEFYSIAGGAVAYVHGSHTTDTFPDGIFNYHWVDDHINVAADMGTSCDDANRPLRYAMVAVLGI
ncbi:Secreted protein [Phytophthora cinnamomi]|uniref:Secreted protein n=1 Tax=Phytophthora cinnamomi TaxID=4785 RepID=UPI003559F3F1|nr:Secreted protein [Phytophthora cinnamomi]